VKYNPKFLFISVLRNSPTGQTAQGIFMLDGSNYADCRIGVPFLAVVDIAAHLWGQLAITISLQWID